MTIEVTNELRSVSPNANEAFSLLSQPQPVSKEGIEEAAEEFLNFGIGREGSGWIVIRSGALGAYIRSRETEGIWIDAYWTATDVERVVDVTGKPKAPLWVVFLILYRCGE